ncbi:hypothetical protein [Halomicrobium urmianum]|uniref:hypothetical protein n=1 Tax=Halomicrobium urmianum TaxID=1586233 RepID=UPI001CD94D1F|nr:hypothetical protein [Halomicrobium urmianum]
MNQDLRNRLGKVDRRPGHVTPEDMGTQSVNTQGQRSRILRDYMDTPHMVRQGRRNPFRVAVPAYEGFTTNATADDTETFSLTHSVVDAPITQSVVVWIGGTYYGTPDSVDYAANEITVTDSGTGNNLHVYYISDAPATMEVRKAVPESSSDASQGLWKDNLGLVHPSPQQEQPEFFDLGDSPGQPWLASDMTLDVYLNAPYTVRWSDPDGDGATPTNALLNVPVKIGSREVPGLTAAIKQDMGNA